VLFFRSDKKPKLLRGTRDELRKIFKNDIEKLEEVLGEDYSKWIK